MKKTVYADIIAVCPVCDEQLPPLMGSAYVIHMIDEHWELVTRIRETTGDDEARARLVSDLAAELAAKNRPA